MLANRWRLTEALARNARLKRQIVRQYGDFLRTLFIVGDWFVTLTFRDRRQDSKFELIRNTDEKIKASTRKLTIRTVEHRNTKCPADPRLEDWEPDSRNRPKSGPPVRDAALREIEHWLIELGWEAAGRKRQEILESLSDGLEFKAKKRFLKLLSGRCLCCAVLADPVACSFYYEMRILATQAIGWVIAEEFGRLGGRWHVHLLITGVQRLRRTKWWKRAFVRFGRTRIEPVRG